MEPEAPLVELRGICKRFDRFVALDHVDLTLRAGEVHALLGENGAGKTTLSNILAGIYRADEGEVLIEGQPALLRSPAQAIAAGIGMVHQHFTLVSAMTVAENLHLGWRETPVRLSQRVLADRCEALMDEVGIRVDPTAEVWQLSVGEQQRVEILRTLARGARIIILDEPTAVLTELEAEELFEILRRLVSGGRTVVFISHKLREVCAVSDTITVLRNGRRVSTEPAAGASIQSLARQMAGADLVRAAERVELTPGAPVLHLEDVSAKSNRGLMALRSVSLTVHEREIVGVAGVSGNGQSELAEVATGLRSLENGRIHISGRDMTGRSSGDFAAAGVGHIAEDRIGTALVKFASVADNAILRQYRSEDLSGRFLMKRGAARSFAERLVKEARVQLRNVNAPVGQLSGGNQKRLVAKREAWVADRLLVAVHPTRGLDVHAAAEVESAVLERREAGCAVLLISDDLDEVLRMSDRVVVIYDGRIVGEFGSGAIDRDRIGLLMGGHVEPEQVGT